MWMAGWLSHSHLIPSMHLYATPSICLVLMMATNKQTKTKTDSHKCNGPSALYVHIHLLRRVCSKALECLLAGCAQRIDRNVRGQETTNQQGYKGPSLLRETERVRPRKVGRREKRLQELTFMYTWWRMGCLDEHLEKEMGILQWRQTSRGRF